MTKHTENSERGKPLGLPLNDVLGAFLCYKIVVDAGGCCATVTTSTTHRREA